MSESPENYEPARKAAIAMLKDGEATLAEIANIAGLPRQSVRHWALQDGVPDWQELRRRRLAAAFRRYGGKPLRGRR